MALLLTACGPQVELNDDTGTGDATESPTTTSPATTTSGPADTTGVDPTGMPTTNAVDIVFVIDNSGTMGDVQGMLVNAAEGFVGTLDSLGLDWRIGVTTTDNGNPWCGTTSPEAGNLQLSSCLMRTAEFVFNGNPPADALAVACTNYCTFEEVPVLPTATDYDPDPKERPWLEPANIPPGMTAVDALRCVMPQGIAGCGFESPLESAYKVMLRSQKESERQYGFLRDHALLMLVFVTDEADCSYNNEYDEIFLPASMGGNQVFWSDPDASAPTSAVCWNAGVACSGAGPYDECHAQDKNVDGIEAGSENDAVLHPVARYVDFLAELEQQKQALDPAARVLVAVIGGVPPGYEKGAEISYAPASDPDIQNNFGIGPACIKFDNIGIAVPAVRERELAEAFTSDGSRNLWSVCDPSLDGAMSGIAQMIAAHVGGG